ncbi:MAG TPA: ABC transporter ATP-binding protein [Candidatus Methylomirabilis sp.]|jgi:lipoprotein-releasing system ATP-binding protein|nr:ABC transporter ATP-binding protein [Candidatus Methylomirabilis sp.]
MSDFVEVRQLHKSFRMGGEELRILKGVTLTVRRGEFLAIVGPSGVGKSTLLHVVGGLDRPTAGGVYYDGVEISGLPEGKLAAFRNRTVGFVFQFHHLLPEFSALENAMMPALIGRHRREEAAEKARGLLQRVGLADRLTHRPGELSGGEQQRVAIARALLLSPRVLLADEPTGNLDAKTGDSIFDLLRELNREQGLTVILVTHNEWLAGQTDRILRIADGQLWETAGAAHGAKRPGGVPPGA